MAKTRKAKQDPDELLTLEQIQAELLVLAARTRKLKALKAKRLRSANPRNRKVPDEKIRQSYDEACWAAKGYRHGIVTALARHYKVSPKTIHRALNRTKNIGTSI